jgi:hypothetical protein
MSEDEYEPEYELESVKVGDNITLEVLCVVRKLDIETEVIDERTDRLQVVPFASSTSLGVHGVTSLAAARD